MPLSVWLGKHVGYHLWIPTLMIGWGVFTIAHAFIKNEAQLYAFRLMIGVFEAGYYPSVAYYFASCYIRFDFALRIATFYVSNSDHTTGSHADETS
jgi:MFS family permease